MNYKNAETDSGNYQNGIYTTKNGIAGLGLNCPRGTRLYDTSLTPAFYKIPEDTTKDEEFRILTTDAAPDVLPYYAISNYGRLINIRSEKLMKPNYRPNGYEYYCLSAENSKYGQKKYNTHRMVMLTFKPRVDSNNLQVNHINGIKSDNYVDKMMEDGSIQSNLEWCNPKYNIVHSRETGLNTGRDKLNKSDADNIRKLHDNGYSYNQIKLNYYPNISTNSIANICKNTIYYDPNYIPKSYLDSYKQNPANIHKLTDDDANRIRDLRNHGYSYQEIKDNFYTNFSIATISDICRGKTHNR